MSAPQQPIPRPAVRRAGAASRWGGAQPQSGQAGQVDRGGQQLEVLGHADQSPYAGAAAAVAAAQQVRELALDLGPGRPVVGQQAGSRWRARAAARAASWGWTATTRPPRLLVQAWRRGHTLQAAPNRARPPPRRAGVMATVTRAGQVTVWA